MDTTFKVERQALQFMETLTRKKKCSLTCFHLDARNLAGLERFSLWCHIRPRLPKLGGGTFPRSRDIICDYHHSKRNILSQQYGWGVELTKKAVLCPLVVKLITMLIKLQKWCRGVHKIAGGFQNMGGNVSICTPKGLHLACGPLVQFNKNKQFSGYFWYRYWKDKHVQVCLFVNSQRLLSPKQRFF